jgi:hypothetical protein
MATRFTRIIASPVSPKTKYTETAEQYAPNGFFREERKAI